MKTTFKIVIISFLIALISSCNGSIKQHTNKKDTGLKLGVQAYTFHKFSFAESIYKVNQLGLHYIEAYYGQPLGKEIGEGKFDFKMDKETIKKVLEYTKSKNVNIIASGVVIPKDTTEWSELFEFAKDMGIKFITCEPKYEHLKYVDSLANKYDIDIAIHNHPKPSLYWNPDLFLEHVKGLNNHIGACVDIGHLKRMGIDPVAALKKYDRRLKTIHIKDIKEKEAGETEQRDIIWGKGVIDIKGVIKELKDQNFKGYLSIEYEYNWENSVPDIKKCITYFNKTINDVYN